MRWRATANSAARRSTSTSGPIVSPAAPSDTAPLVTRLRARNEWNFFAVLPRADAALAAAWWLLLVLRGTLPAVFAAACGRLAAGCQHRSPAGAALAFAAAVVG